MYSTDRLNTKLLNSILYPIHNIRGLGDTVLKHLYSIQLLPRFWTVLELKCISRFREVALCPVSSVDQKNHTLVHSDSIFQCD